jgi:hypothetical protein
MAQEYRKELFAKYLDNIRNSIYTGILDSNSELIHKLYNKKKSQNLRSNPLWLLHGGELINLYSDDDNKVRTKDIDLKLYLTGEYNIPHELFNRSIKKIKLNSLGKFKKSMGKHYKTWDICERQKIDMCISPLVNSLDGNFSQMNIKTGELTHNKSLKNIKTSSTQKWVDGDDCSAFIINVPYITQVGRHNIPYDLSDDVITEYGGYYDEDMDGYYIYDELLENVDEQLASFEKLFNNKKEKKTYLQNEVMKARLKSQKFKLSTVVGLIIVYNKTKDQLFLFQEGLLDTYIDYSAGDHLKEELEYLGRYADGSFPSIIKKVKYNGKNGIMKIPTLTWIIYDQLRMLYVVLRGEYLLCDHDRCKWTTLGGGAANNYEKYFKKLSGLLLSFNNVLQNLHTRDVEALGAEIKKCKDTNIEYCGFNSYISKLFDNLLNNSTSLKSPTGRSKKTRRKTARKLQRKSRDSKFINELKLRDNDMFV